MDLTNRLKKLTSYVDKGMKVADIGCDHGYVPIYLIKQDIASFALAMDINKDPLTKAKNNAIAYKVEERFEARLSNGLSKLNEYEVNCVIIAGMGGKLMEEILEKDAHKLHTFQRLVLSPHKDIMAVREKLYALNIKIVHEDMIFEEKHYYNFIIAEPGNQKVSEEEIEFDQNQKLKFHEDIELLHKIYNKYGKILIMNKNQLLRQQIEEMIQKQTELLIELKSKKLDFRAAEIVDEITIGKKVLNWLT